MKLSCLPVSLFQTIADRRMTIPEWAETAGQIGFNGFDISSMLVSNHTPVYLKWLCREISRTAVPLIMMTSYPDFTVPDDRQREREETYFLADLALASQLRCRYVRITSGQAYPETDCVQTMDQVTEIFKKMREAADKMHIRLVYENHAKPSAWDNYDFTYEPQLFLKFCERLKRMDVGINFDIGNPTAYGMDSCWLLEQIHDQVETVHISDMEESGQFLPAPVGRGQAPVMKTLRLLLNKYKFSGWFSIEEASGNGLQGIQSAYEYIRNAEEIITARA